MLYNTDRRDETSRGPSFVALLHPRGIGIDYIDEGLSVQKGAKSFEKRGGEIGSHGNPSMHRAKVLGQGSG